MITRYKALPHELRGDSFFMLPGDIELVTATDYDAMKAERDRWKARAEAAEHRLEHPPLAENQDDLARICYDAYMAYVSSGDSETWDEVGAWESYGWRLAANAVRVATEAERDELKRRLDAIIGHSHAHTLESWAHDVLAIAEGRDNG